MGERKRNSVHLLARALDSLHGPRVYEALCGAVATSRCFAMEERALCERCQDAKTQRALVLDLERLARSHALEVAELEEQLRNEKQDARAALDGAARENRELRREAATLRARLSRRGRPARRVTR